MTTTDPNLILDPRPDDPPSTFGEGQSVQGDIRSARIEVIATADDQVNVTEPSTPTHPQFPYNSVKQSISGHLEEIDDTPGAERLLKQHKAGSYEEIHPDGSRVLKIFGKDFYLVLDDHTLFVGGNLNISVQGNANLLVAGDLKTKVSGNVETVIHGNYTQRVSGNSTFYSNGDTNIQSKGNLNTHSDKTTQIDANTKVTIGSNDVEVVGTTSLTLTGEDVICSGENQTLFNNGSSSIGVNGNVATISADTINLRSTTINNWSTNYHSNSGGTSSAGTDPGTGPTPGTLSYTKPASLDIGPGLEVPDSIIQPSVESQMATRSDNVATLQTVDTGITYPKDRKKFTD